MQALTRTSAPSTAAVAFRDPAMQPVTLATAITDAARETQNLANALNELDRRLQLVQSPIAAKNDPRERFLSTFFADKAIPASPPRDDLAPATAALVDLGRRISTVYAFADSLILSLNIGQEGGGQ